MRKTIWFVVWFLLCSQAYGQTVGPTNFNGGSSSGSSVSFPLTSPTANPALSGQLRLANNTDKICWRNAANTADICIYVDSSNVLQLPGASVGTATNLSGGGVGSAPYQSAASTTTFIASPTTTGHTFVYAWQPSGSAIAPTALDLVSFPAVPTATNLASYPSACTGVNFSQGLSSGSNNCAQPSNVTGNAATAPDLASYTSYSVFGAGNAAKTWMTPTANGQCLMSGASSYATTTPSFQTCPTGGGPGTGTLYADANWATTSTLGSQVGTKTGQIKTASNGAAAAYLSPGIGVSPNSPVTSSAYMLACDSSTALVDRGATVEFDSGASAPVVPDVGDSGCGVGTVFKVYNASGGSLTYGRETASTFNIFYADTTTPTTAQTSFALTNGQRATINAIASSVWRVDVTGLGTTGNAATATTISNGMNRALGYSFGDATTNLPLSTAEAGYITVPFACAITGWQIMVNQGTMTVRTAKIATGGTALPTLASNSISTAGVSISAGTLVRSTVVTDFTSTAVAAGDTLGFFITAASTVEQATFQLTCNQTVFP